MKLKWCGCLPWRTGRIDQSEPTGNAVDRSNEKRQQPLTDFFHESELSVFGSLASRVRVIIDDSLPSTLHGTSRVTDGVPLAIVNYRFL